MVVETETKRDWEFLWLSRPRLNETGIFCGCRERDQSRLNKSCRDQDFFESLVNHCFKLPSWDRIFIPNAISKEEISYNKILIFYIVDEDSSNFLKRISSFINYAFSFSSRTSRKKWVFGEIYHISFTPLPPYPKDDI